MSLIDNMQSCLGKKLAVRLSGVKCTVRTPQLKKVVRERDSILRNPRRSNLIKNMALSYTSKFPIFQSAKL